MAMGWPDQVTQYVQQCLLHLWTQQQTPGWLQRSWICPKPKNLEEEVTLDGLRPLLLLEVIRKLWTGIIVGRITLAWERHHVLATAQQGFRPGRGTDTALLQFINALEHAEETGIPLYPSSWDIRRAFDPVSREAMELGWTRQGVLTQIAGWLVRYGNVVAAPIRGLPNHPLYGRPQHLPAGTGHATRGCHQPSQLDQLLRHRPTDFRARCRGPHLPRTHP